MSQGEVMLTDVSIIYHLTRVCIVGGIKSDEYAFYTT